MDVSSVVTESDHEMLTVDGARTAMTNAQWGSSGLLRGLEVRETDVIISTLAKCKLPNVGHSTGFALLLESCQQ